MRDLSAYALRRDYLLDDAISAGKFSPERRAHWHAHYDRDPAATEQTLAVLAAFPGISPATNPGDRARITRGATAAQPIRLPSLVASAEHPRPAAPPPEASEGELSPKLVAQWSHDVFPETVRASAPMRVMKAND